MVVGVYTTFFHKKYRAGNDSSSVMGRRRDGMGKEIASHADCIYNDLYLQGVKI